MLEPNIHQSDSSAQRTAETAALAALNTARGLNLKPATLTLPNKRHVQIDGVDRDAKIACEIYARIGKLKGAQPDKLASDILKLIVLERQFGGTWQKLICFIDTDAAQALNNASWLASTCTTFGIEVVLASIPTAIRQAVLDAQRRQKMINAVE